MIICGDALAELRKLPNESVSCCITSPPYYGLRDYGIRGQLGLEQTPEIYNAKLVEVFREVRRVLKKDGTLWLVIGDSYVGTNNTNIGGNANFGSMADVSVASQIKSQWTGLKPKNLIGIPWRVAFALQADGWYLRQDIIWSKPNPMPESVRDRCTRTHEYIFMLTKSAHYFYNAEAIKEQSIYFDDDPLGRAKLEHKSNPTEMINGIRPRIDKQRGHSRRHAGFNDRWDKMTTKAQCSAMRNKRSVWTISTKPFLGAHFATFPSDLVRPMILAGCPVRGTVLDPFFGAGTTGMVAKELGRDFLGIELNPAYCRMAEKRIAQVAYQPPLISSLPSGG